jgi:outer membrane protein OmpA-like peptidoglycan-associated protein
LIEALGEKVPVAENSSEAGRKKNRRVEVRFIED